MSWPPSSRKIRKRETIMKIKTKRGDFREVEDIVSDAVADSLESPFNALESVFDSLGDLFGDSSNLTARGLESDMVKLKADLAKMKHDLRAGKRKISHPTTLPSAPVMPSNVSLGGGATFSIGGTGKKHKHHMKLKDEDGNLVEVTFNSPSDLSIRTEGSLDTELMEEVKRHVRAQLERKDPINVLHAKETYEVEEPTRERSPLLWTRSWRGDKKDPLDFSPTESKVTVSGPSMLNRKYNVEVDGTTIYIVKIEEMMENCHRRGDLDDFVNMWTDDEKAIMRKIFEGLKTLDYIEEHHIAAQELLSP